TDCGLFVLQFDKLTVDSGAAVRLVATPVRRRMQQPGSSNNNNNLSVPLRSLSQRPSADDDSQEVEEASVVGQKRKIDNISSSHNNMCKLLAKSGSSTDGSVVLFLSEASMQGLTAAERRAVQQTLGGRPSAAAGATHVVVTDRTLRRPVWLMCAMCRGQHVVLLSWVKASLRANRWVSVRGHLSLRNAEGEELLCEEARQRARERPLLEGWKVFVFPSLPAGERYAALEVVAAAGGTGVFASLPPQQAVPKSVLRQLRQLPSLLLVGLQSDVPAARELDSSLPLYAPEFLFEAAMTQLLNLEQGSGQTVIL
ncbi:unnamed protein product, partial [Polarella glacialis]